MRAKRTGIYRSKLEARFASHHHFDYEDTHLKYTVPAYVATYTPDFRVPGTSLFIETKGLFGAGDRQKMLLVKEQHPDKTFILVFQKDLLLGARLGTCLEWAKKHGFPAFLESDVNSLKEFINANPR